MHYRALREHGPSPQHRRTFRPLAEFLATGIWPQLHGDATMEYSAKAYNVMRKT
jgi:hypothetical protein